MKPVREFPAKDEPSIEPRTKHGVLLAWLMLLIGAAPVAHAIAHDDWGFDASMGFLIALFSLKGLTKHCVAQWRQRPLLREEPSLPTLGRPSTEEPRHGSAVHGRHVWVLSRIVGVRKTLRADLNDLDGLAPRESKRKP